MGGLLDSDTASKRDINIDHWRRPAWQQRVIEEQQELDDRRKKLKAFLDSPAHDAGIKREKVHLRCQLVAMDVYSSILELRIQEWSS